MHSNVTAKTRNSFTAWREVSPFHNQLVDAMLKSRCHVIATIRAKTEYVVEEGGKKIQKVGLAPIQRDGLEYEFTIFADISTTHSVTISKDRTGQWQDRTFVITRQFGEDLLRWLNSGAPVQQQAAPPASQKPAPAEPPTRPPVSNTAPKPAPAEPSVKTPTSPETNPQLYQFIKAEKVKARNGSDLARVALKDANKEITVWAKDDMVSIADLAPNTVVEVALLEENGVFVVSKYRAVQKGEVA